MHLHAHADASRVLIAGQLSTFLAWFLRSKSGTPDIFPDIRIDYFAAVYSETDVLDAALGFYHALAESIDAVRAIVAASSFDREVLVVSGETGRGQQMIGGRGTLAERGRSRAGWTRTLPPGGGTRHNRRPHPIVGYRG
ncbi:hypothetical protein [Pseudonocardia sp.]|jgi:hypothetical protein|uniref:hypothetical protein n=1 Tax=Pseudonocardia sp. TaxID=60912 RepID=UPI00262B13E4|nr:hypothetical protein [Pseudonocardia sp.]